MLGVCVVRVISEKTAATVAHYKVTRFIRTLNARRTEVAAVVTTRRSHMCKIGRDRRVVRICDSCRAAQNANPA